MNQSPPAGRGRAVLVSLIALMLAFAAFVAGFGLGYRAEAAPAGRTIAIAWGDGRFGPAFYGAHVFVREADSTDGPLSVRAVVYIDRPDRFVSYQHDCGEIGLARSWSDAVARFGTIRWSPDGLRIGSGDPADYFLSREQLENHR